MANRCPELAQEWHPYKNDPLTPDDVSSGSNRVVWWQCAKHPETEWEGRIRTRVRGFERCQKCSPSQRDSIDPNKVKELLGLGFKQKEVAEKLGISVASVQRLK